MSFYLSAQLDCKLTEEGIMSLFSILFLTLRIVADVLKKWIVVVFPSSDTSASEIYNAKSLVMIFNSDLLRLLDNTKHIEKVTRNICKQFWDKLLES